MVVAAVSIFFFGGMYYSPMGVLKVWLAENEKSHTKFPKHTPEMSGHMKWVYAFSFFCSLVAAFVFNAYLEHANITDVATATWQGALIGFAFVTTSLGTTYAFSGKTMMLTLIDGAYHVITWAQFGAILALLKAY